MPTMSDSQPVVFGATPSSPDGVSDFLKTTVSTLKANGLSVPLLFQNVTRRSDVEKLRSRVERGGTLPLEKLEVNLIAELLKLYLLELPEPLVPYKAYDVLLGYRAEEISSADLKKHVATFPESNLLSLGYVISLLFDVSRNIQVTKMSTNALATVFAPILLRSKDESMTGMISDALPTQRVVRALIDNYETLFKPALLAAGLLQPASSLPVSTSGDSITPPPTSATPPPPPAPTVPPPPTVVSSSPSFPTPPSSVPPPPPTTPAPSFKPFTPSNDPDTKPVTVALKKPLHAMEPPPIMPKPVLPKRLTFADDTKKKPPALPEKPDRLLRERGLDGSGTDLKDDGSKGEISRELNAVKGLLASKADRESHQPHLNLGLNLDQLVNTLIDTQKEDAIPLSSRLSFKPVEKAKSPKSDAVILSQGWKFEQGNANVTIEQQLPFVIIDQEKNFPHYEAFFYGKDHVNYLAPETEIGPIVISVEKKADESSSFSTKALLRSLDAYEMLALPQKIKKAGDLNKALKSNYPQLADVHFKEVRERTGDGDLSKNLLNYERANIFNSCKFGVLYRRTGQVNEDEMFANNTTSPAFEEFMQLIGSRITLSGWPGFRGGLDTQRGTTGLHSYYTKYAGFEIMYHVAPLLPFYPNDKQQLERKRHLGNDIVVIVFQDTDEPFAPAWIKSEFIHIYGIVSPADDGRRYRFSVAAKEDVPACGPFLPSPAVFEKDDNFRHFFLTKLINLERVALYAPVFADKMRRTRKRLLDACNKEFQDSKQQGTFRLTPHTTKTKLEKIFSTVRLPGKKDEPASTSPSTGAFASAAKGPAISGPLNMNEMRELSPSHTRPADDTISRALSPDPSKKRGKILPEWTLAAEANTGVVRQRSGSAIDPSAPSAPPSGLAASTEDANKKPAGDNNNNNNNKLAISREDSGPSPTTMASVASGKPTAASLPVASSSASPEPIEIVAVDVEELQQQVRLTPKERVVLAQLEADAKAVANDVRSLLSQVQSAFTAKPTQEEAPVLQSFFKVALSALETQLQDAHPSMLVKRPAAAELKHPLDAAGVEALQPRFAQLLALLKQQEKDVEIAPTPDDALKRARPMVSLLKICRAYLDKQVMTLEEEQQKIRELRTSIVTAARDVQYRLVFMQSQIRSGALSAERALPLLKEICKRIGLESACGAADAVTRLQRLVKELSAERVALDQRLLLARFVEIGQLVRAAKKELITNYDVPPAPIAQLTQVDPGYALSACTSELERLYTDLAEEARTLEQAVAYARLVRAVKKYIKGQDLLPASITKPLYAEKSMTEIERMKLNSLKEVSAYGIMEIKSKLQLDSLNVMKDTDDDEPGVRFDLLSQCLLLETVKDFIASFRPESKQQQQGTTPATWSGKSLDALASKPPAAAAAAASGASTTTTTVSAPQMDGQEWAKLVALKKAMTDTAEDLLGSLVSLQKQIVTCSDAGQASAIARLAVGLKAVCNGTTDPTQVEFVKRVEPSPQVSTPEELANVSNLRSVAEVVIDETRAWVASQKRALHHAEDLQSAVRIGKGINLLRKLLEAYHRG